ncbi:hypothetical protein HY988_03465 [Candidatus Micrarchaeota archaeon]|nr:hypothetical protein [Candidatus Micrarchaeota archaeon]
MKTNQIVVGSVTKLAYVIAAVLLLTGISFASVTVESTSGGPPPKVNGILQVVKTAPENVALGEQFNVDIVITNLGKDSVNATVQESLGNVEPISDVPIYSDPESDVYAAEPPKLIWVVNIAPGATQTISYTVKPISVGVISMGPTSVFVSGSKFFSNSLFVNVECSSSPTCDPKIGEGPLTCPAKCGGNISVAPPAAPEQQLIPTPPVNDPVKNPESVVTDEDKARLDEYNNRQNMEYVIIVVVVFIVFGGSFLFLRKKK